MARCPACETDYPEGLEACPACAGGPGEVFWCERCGERYAGSDACLACGALRGPCACEAHPDRAADGRCVVCARALCAACGGATRPARLCEEHREVRVIEGWGQVYSTTSEFEAQLLRDNLLAEGVEAQIFSQRDKMFSVEIGDLGIVRILVPVWEYREARRLIRDHTVPGGAVSFACPVCGEAYEDGAAACGGCGAPVGSGPAR